MKKYNLILTAGIIWLLVGIMLINRALSWTNTVPDGWLLVVILLGLLIGVVKYLLIFGKVGKKNIKRIEDFKEEKNNFFKLYSPKTYLIIILMITGGIILRHLEFIPKYVLLPLYLGIGIAMSLASFLFFIKKYKNIK